MGKKQFLTFILIALASSLDQVGPFAKTVADAEILFQVIDGQDPLDATTVAEALAKQEEIDIKKLRIGVPKEYFGKGLDSEVEKVIRKAVESFEKNGAVIKEIELPHFSYALAAYYIINFSEASSNLAKYDGMRFGKTSEGEDLLATYLKSRGEYLGAEVKRRIMLGTYALSEGYYDAYYLKAQKMRTLLKEDFEKAFKDVDVILGPVCPSLPYKIGERSSDPLEMYLGDIYTVPANLVGLPALSVPAGFAQGLPVGLQLTAAHFKEDFLFAIGKIFEKIRT